MYRTVSDFLNDWKHESANTVKLLHAITDEALSQRVYENGRELGPLAFHLSQAMGAMLNQAGLHVTGPDRNDPIPTSADELVRVYESASNSLMEQAATWSDEDLTQDVPMFGQVWKKGTVLSATLLHQTHHRGQMTVLMRQAGLKVPGMYGPAREEWAAFGMPEMA